MGRMHGLKIAVLLFILGGILGSFPKELRAEQDGKLDLRSSVAKEARVSKNGQGVVVMLPAEQAAPGETLVFTIDYTNAGGSAVTKAVIVNPLPTGVVLKPESPEGQDTEVNCSIDNGRSYLPVPIMVRTKKGDGSEVLEPAPPERYTHVKWTMKKPVMPGQSGRVSFKATVK